MKRLAVVVMTSACALVSCVQMEEQSALEIGYLSAPVMQVDVTVDALAPTKAQDPIVIEAPEVSEVTFIVKDKDGQVKYNKKGLWSDPLTLPVGAYSIEATFGSNDSFGSPYFTGETSGTVEPLESEVPSLSLSIKNSLVKVQVNESLSSHFIPGQTVVFTPGNYQATYGEWTFVPSLTSLTLSLKGKSSTGNDATFIYELSDLASGFAYNVVCGKDLADLPSISLSVKAEDAWASRIYITQPASFSENISQENKESVVYEAIPASSDWSNAADVETAEPEGDVYVFKELTPGEYKVRARVGALPSNVVTVNTALDAANDMTVTATHTYTSGDLDGTDVSMTLNNKSSYIRNAVSQWNLALYNAAGGNALRSGLAVDAVSDGSEITSGWPFLPTGGGEKYILRAGVVMDGKEHTMSPSVAFANQPTFTVTASGYTTYDKYCDYLTSKSAADLNAANQEGKAEYIFQISSSVTISENLLNNPNYTKKVYYTCGPYTDIAYDFVNGEGDTDTAVKVHNIGDMGGFSWGQNTLTAGVSFAGTRFNSAGDVCHITGLPYKAAPPTNSGDYPWTEDQKASGGLETFSWGQSEFYMYDNAATGTYLRVGTPQFKLLDNVPINVVTSTHGCRNAGISTDVTCRIYSYGETADFKAEYNGGTYSNDSITTLTLYSASPKLQFENRNHTAYGKLYIKMVSITYR